MKKIFVMLAACLMFCSGAFALGLKDIEGKKWEAHPTFFITANVTFLEEEPNIDFTMKVGEKVKASKYTYKITSSKDNYYEMDWYDAKGEKYMSVKLTVNSADSLTMKSSKGTFNLVPAKQ